jgi:hypothetical protein
VALIATAEVGRVLRFANVPLGVWIAVSTWLLGDAASLSAWNNLLAGAAIAGLSLPRGSVRERYRSWDRFVR